MCKNGWRLIVRPQQIVRIDAVNFVCSYPGRLKKLISENPVDQTPTIAVDQGKP